MVCVIIIIYSLLFAILYKRQLSILSMYVLRLSVHK